MARMALTELFMYRKIIKSIEKIQCMLFQNSRFFCITQRRRFLRQRFDVISATYTKYCKLIWSDKSLCCTYSKIYNRRVLNDKEFEALRAFMAKTF